MTKPKTPAVRAAVKTLSFQDTHCTADEQAIKAIKNMAIANNWGTHLTQIQLKETSKNQAFLRTRALVLLAGGGYDDNMTAGGIDVFTILEMGKNVHEQGGLVINVYDPEGSSSEDTLWIPKAPALNAELVELLFDENIEVRWNDKGHGDDHMIHIEGVKAEDGVKLKEVAFTIVAHSNKEKTNCLIRRLRGVEPVTILKAEVV